MRRKQKLINLYEDRDISSIKVVFSVGCEDDLNQCWHYFENHFHDQNDTLQLFLITLYNMSNELIESSKDTFFEVIVEESEKHYFFTIWNAIVSNKFAKILKKKDLKYKSDSTRITAKIKKDVPAQFATIDIPGEESKKVEKRVKKEKTPETVVAPIQLKTDLQSNIPKYTFLSCEDLEEILELCDDMVDVIGSARTAGLNDNSYIKLRSLFSSFSILVGYYKDLYDIADIMKELSALINVYQNKFIEMSADELALVEGFINNLERWVSIVFVKGGADIHFLDASLHADFETIKMSVEPEAESTEEDFDDIFDF